MSPREDVLSAFSLGCHWEVITMAKLCQDKTRVPRIWKRMVQLDASLVTILTHLEDR